MIFLISIRLQCRHGPLGELGCDTLLGMREGMGYVLHLFASLEMFYLIEHDHDGRRSS